MSERLSRYVQKAVPILFSIAALGSARDVNAGSTPVDLSTPDKQIVQVDNPQDPAGQEVALALTVKGQEVNVIRKPIDADLLNELLGTLQLPADTSGNEIIWDSIYVNPGDVKLVELTGLGSPTYATVTTVDGKRAITRYSSAVEAKFALFPAVVTNLPAGANLREQPSASGPVHHTDGAKAFYTGITEPDASVPGRVWFEVKFKNGDTFYVSKEALGGEIQFTQKTDLVSANEDSIIKSVVDLPLGEISTEDLDTKYPEFAKSKAWQIQKTSIENNNNSVRLLHLLVPEGGPRVETLEIGNGATVTVAIVLLPDPIANEGWREVRLILSEKNPNKNCTFKVIMLQNPTTGFFSAVDQTVALRSMQPGSTVLATVWNLSDVDPSSVQCPEDIELTQVINPETYYLYFLQG